ncbi:polyketide synthase dehydratase domain-containing protein [Mycobacterium tuberculosis]
MVLDAALQSVGAAIPDGEIAGSAEASYLPVSFETIRVYRDIGRRWCRAHLTNLDAGTGRWAGSS